MLVAVGLNQRAAAVADRESLTVAGDDLEAVLGAYASLDGVDEVAVLSTCYRVEAYAIASCPAAAALSLRRALEARAGRALPLLELRGADAFRHLVRVAAGLESAVLGEPAVQAKVEAAFGRAVHAGAAGGELATIGAEALGIASRVRGETALGAHATSWGHAAAALAGKILGSLAGVPVTVVGAGELARLAARQLRAEGASITIVNRTAAAARALADDVGGRALPADALEAELRSADVVVFAAPSPEPLGAERLAAIVRARRRRLVVVDLAVPRAIPESAGRVEDVYLVDVDDLDRVIRATQDGSSAAVAAAERIVADGVRRWERAERERRAALDGDGLLEAAAHIFDRPPHLDDAAPRRARPV